MKQYLLHINAEVRAFLIEFIHHQLGPGFLLVLLTCCSNSALNSDEQWLVAGHDLQNTRYISYRSLKRKEMDHMVFDWGVARPGEVRTGDIDNDGDLEILKSCDGNLEIYSHNGLLTRIIHVSGRPFFADLYGRGSLNMISISSTDIQILDAKGIRTHIIPKDSTNSSGAPSARFADLDRDGILEMIIGYQSSGTEGFRGIVMYDFINAQEWEPVWSYEINAQPIIDAIGDIDGDGSDDIVIGTYAPHNRPQHDTIAGTTDGGGYLICLDRDGKEVLTECVIDSPFVRIEASLVDIDEDDSYEIAVAGSSFKNNWGYFGLIDARQGNARTIREAHYEYSIYTPGIADIGDEPGPEIVVGTGKGMLIIFNSRGEMCARSENIEDHHVSEGTLIQKHLVIASLADVDGDGETNVFALSCTEATRELGVNFTDMRTRSYGASLYRYRKRVEKVKEFLLHSRENPAGIYLTFPFQYGFACPLHRNRGFSLVTFYPFLMIHSFD
jgi:hypothetical protein